MANMGVAHNHQVGDEDRRESFKTVGVADAVTIGRGVGRKWPTPRTHRSIHGSFRKDTTNTHVTL